MRGSLVGLTVVLYGVIAQAQPVTTFSSGSTGADGALTYAPNLGMVYFPPSGLAPRPNNIYNFTSITIGAGTTVRLSGWVLNGSVYWLAQSDVTISGTLDLSGGLGHPPKSAGQRAPSEPGAGGYSGGLAPGANAGQNPTAGSGPGGGPAPGWDSSNPNNAGSGTLIGSNIYLQPLIGGSGGAGGCQPSFYNANGVNCGGGGAGGGALLIASSTQIVMTNTAFIYALGGNGNANYSGGGSGGAIRLVSNTINGRCGGIQVFGGAPGNCVTSSVLGCPEPPNGGSGIARLEAFTNNLTPACISGTSYFSTPISLGLPTTNRPTISIASINNSIINANPFSFPDLTIVTGSPIPVVISGVNIPPATKGTLYIFSEMAPDQAIPFTLTGTLAATTATVNVSYPPSGSRGFAKVTF